MVKKKRKYNWAFRFMPDGYMLYSKRSKFENHYVFVPINPNITPYYRELTSQPKSQFEVLTGFSDWIGTNWAFSCHIDKLIKEVTEKRNFKEVFEREKIFIILKRPYGSKVERALNG